MNNKLRVGVISNSPLAKTGLGRNVKSWMPLLYKTHKYELFFLNQGSADNLPEYQKLPWANEGVMKNFDQNRFNQDPNYQRFVAYSNCTAEDWVIRNKLDVVLALDDPWSWDLSVFCKSDWYNYIKQNFLFDITLDSEPIIPHAKELAKNCPNFHVWSGFAERLLKQEDSKLYGHIKTLRGGINIEEFKPLSKQEKLDLRHKFGISDDEKIIMYLGRNQLRKNSFHANQEALAIWKQKYPDKKIRLLFHTKFNEPSGWPIDQIREELKLNKEDILCTYFCRNCGDWNLQNYTGEDLDCQICKNQRSRVTAGVDSNINEHDLNKIYNIADACCSSFTSGGQEYCLVESMLSGLPTACPDYSCGEDFILSGFIKEIKGTYYREFNTSFYKFTPNIDSVVEFYEYIWNLKEDDRDKLVKNAREWAVKEFSSESIAKQIESFIDSCKPIDWDSFIKGKQELKDINAQVEDKQNDDEFVIECYKKILNMQPDEKDEGRIHWNNFLKQPKDKGQLKNEMVNAMRQAGMVHNQKVKPNSFEDLLDNSGRKRVGIIIPESIGDVFLVTAILKSLRERYSKNDWALHFITKPEFFEILDCNENIDKLVPYSPDLDNLLLMEGQGTNKGFFDVLYPVHFGTQRLLNYMHNGKDIKHLDNSYN